MTKIKYGLSNVFYSIITYGEDGAEQYAKPVALPGAVSLTADQQSTDNPFYADNIVYFRTQANNGYSGSLEIAFLPKSFYTDVLGYRTDSSGLLVESSADKAKEFALLGQFETDDANRKWCFYRCTASRPSAGTTTRTDTIEPQTDAFDLQMMPRLSDGVIRAVAEPEHASYATWTDSVPAPSFEEVPGV